MCEEICPFHEVACNIDSHESKDKTFVNGLIMRYKIHKHEGCQFWTEEVIKEPEEIIDIPEEEIKEEIKDAT